MPFTPKGQQMYGWDNNSLSSIKQINNMFVGDLVVNTSNSALQILDKTAKPGDMIEATSNTTGVIVGNIDNNKNNCPFPVDCIHLTMTTTNPSTLWPGTTWTRFAEGTLLGSIGTTAPFNGAPGARIGSNNAIAVSHTHTTPNHTHTVSGTAASGGAHTHTVSGTAVSGGAHTHTASTGSAGAHTHSLKYASNATAGTARNVPTANGNQSSGFGMSSEGAHTHTVSVASGGAHTHTVSGTAASGGGSNTGSTGSSGTNANIPLTTLVYMWRRTA